MVFGKAPFSPPFASRDSKNGCDPKSHCRLPKSTSFADDLYEAAHWKSRHEKSGQQMEEEAARN
jgi:hypothetical protein